MSAKHLIGFLLSRQVWHLKVLVWFCGNAVQTYISLDRSYVPSTLTSLWPQKMIRIRMHRNNQALSLWAETVIEQ